MACTATLHAQQLREHRCAGSLAAPNFLLRMISIFEQHSNFITGINNKRGGAPAGRFACSRRRWFGTMHEHVALYDWRPGDRLCARSIAMVWRRRLTARHRVLELSPTRVDSKLRTWGRPRRACVVWSDCRGQRAPEKKSGRPRGPSPQMNSRCFCSCSS